MPNFTGLTVLPLTLSKSIYGNDLIPASEEFLSISIVGDWGGFTTRPYQIRYGYRVAESMNRMVNLANTDFLMLIGDNFYENGIQNVEDSRFQTTFENTFHSGLTNLLDMPMWIQSGNHDYRGNVTAEILYTETQNRWKYPKLWYKIPTKEYNNFSIDIFMIDTNALKAMKSIEEDASIVQQRQTEHYNWLESELEKSTADYIIVSGHHTIQSVAEHGPDQDLINNLRPLLKKYKVNFYINGHDHQLQVLSEKYYENECQSGPEMNLQYIVSGMATVPNPSRKHKNDLEDGVNLDFYYGKTGLDAYGGYAQIIADESSLRVYMIDAENEQVLFMTSSDRRRVSKN